mgnify:FL=1
MGGKEICGSGVMFWAGCVTGGAVGSSEKEGRYRCDLLGDWEVRKVHFGTGF